MEDMQLNISVPKKGKTKSEVLSKKAEYKFLSNPKFVGKTIARKRSNKPLGKTLLEKSIEEPVKEVHEPSNKSRNLATNLRDLSENKGKYFGKNYQELSDDIESKSKPRSGGWISSLFKNNPDVPRIGQRAVKPIVEKVFSGKTFSDLNIHPHSVSNLQQNLGLKELTTVQQHSIPVILEGRDVLIRSQTGSGKTLAYALPIIEALQEIRPKINRHDGIRVVVVVPTRELAVQTYELLIKLVKPFTWVVPGLLSGGQKRKAEKARLRKGLNILVGTPGRINDHLRHTKSINFAKTGCLVLDEADRLLDMGYEQDVAAIVKAIESHKQAATYDPMALVKSTIKKNFDEEQVDEQKQEPSNETNYKHNVTEVFLSKARQTILLSATLTKAVENLAGIAMVDPVFVDTSEGRAVIADSLQTSQFNKVREKEVKILKTGDEAHNKSNFELERNQNKVKEKDVKDKTEIKRGLQAFRGLSSLGSETGNVSGKSKQKQLSSESDSDSDYEYFKVEKELQEKKKSVENTEDIKPSNISSTFDNAIKSAIGEDELVLPATVNQTFLIVPMKLRLVTLCSLIVEHCVLNKKGGKMIVFMATLEMVDYHADLLEAVLTGKEGHAKKSDQEKKASVNKKRKANDDNDDASQSDSEFEVDYEAPAEGGLAPVEVDIFRLHGSMPHEQRMEVFKQFRTARNGVLICTDVAARGLDVARVDLVLQYCVPASATDYVHRVGRTGRAAQVGAAVLFLLPSETEFVRHLEQKRIRLRQFDESKCLESLRVVAPTAASSGRAAVAVQSRAEYVVYGNSEWRARAARAYTSWVRFYSGYPRDVRQYLDARQLHLGHAAKAFALRDTPAALGRRAKQDPQLKKDKPVNRLTVEQTKRPGFPRMKVDTFPKRVVNKQSSMHTASEFDSGLTSTHQTPQKKKKT